MFGDGVGMGGNEVGVEGGDDVVEHDCVLVLRIPNI